jgi:hypothetical protein
MIKRATFDGRDLGLGSRPISALWKQRGCVHPGALRMERPPSQTVQARSAHLLRPAREVRR